jgi:hypothetical protein
LGRFLLAVRSFFAILFRGRLPEDVVLTLGLGGGAKEATSPTAPVRVSDGALQLLGILQRDSRLVDFLMEDITDYSDEQIGAAVRDLHGQCRQSLMRYVRLAPVVDAVEGSFTKLEGLSIDPSRMKLLGNVPPDGHAGGGILRHKGWRAEEVKLPGLGLSHDVSIIAPAEIEIE